MATAATASQLSKLARQSSVMFSNAVQHECPLRYPDRFGDSLEWNVPYIWSNMTFSYILERAVKTDTGRWQVLSISSSFLNTGEMLLLFQTVGQARFFRKWLFKVVSGCARDGADIDATASERCCRNLLHSVGLASPVYRLYRRPQLQWSWNLFATRSSRI